MRVSHLQQGSSETLVWRRISTQGLVWWKAEVTLKSDPRSPITNVILEGVVGDGDKGDIVVDDMDIKTGACSELNETCCDKFKLYLWLITYYII